MHIFGGQLETRKEAIYYSHSSIYGTLWNFYFVNGAARRNKQPPFGDCGALRYLSRHFQSPHGLSIAQVSLARDRPATGPNESDRDYDWAGAWST
jgi:hypothetical protein